MSAWNWNYPVGAGDYAALYPKSWFAYKSDQLPVTLTLEQFSPILPDNYKETSYPVAVYRWHAENTTDKAVTVSLMLSWQNLLGAFRTFGRDLKGRISPLLYVLGIVTAFLQPWIGCAFYVAVAVMWIVPDRRIERGLEG